MNKPAPKGKPKELYSQKTIEQFTRYVHGDSGGLNYLIEHKHQDLLATLDAIRGDSDAFKLLMNSKKFILAAFANAVWEDKQALQLLLKFAPEWAAMVNIINGDENAIRFLILNKKQHYINLAHAIQTRIREDGNRSTNPFQMLKNIFSFRKK
jgi:hypothetical protein